MQKKLTISLNAKVYQDLHDIVGRGKISKFIENLIKPYTTSEYLELAYREKAHDIEAEGEAYEWIEGTLGDNGNN